MSRTEKRILWAILAVAFLARLSVRVTYGDRYFWANSYEGYFALAQNVVAGKGFCFDAICAFWPPLYPLFLAVTALPAEHYLLIIVPQALMGAATALLAFLIGRHLFDAAVGLAAGAVTAVYPYYVMHDTALQETGMITFVTALAVWLLLRATGRQTLAAWAAAGFALGAMALTRASVAPGIALAVVWVAVWGASGDVRTRMVRAATVLLAIAAVVAPWLIRTYRVSGRATLTSQTGRALWIGNNADTFSHYPAESIDLSTVEASNKLPAADVAELNRITNEFEESDWYQRRGSAFIREHPGLTAWHALLKIKAGFWWRINPLRQPVVQAAYALSYVPVAVLGITGMFMARRKRGTILIALLFAGFICTTALFWAHTSHRTYLDVYWIVFAAATVTGAMRSGGFGGRVWARRARQRTRSMSRTPNEARLLLPAGYTKGDPRRRAI